MVAGESGRSWGPAEMEAARSTRFPEGRLQGPQTLDKDKGEPAAGIQAGTPKSAVASSHDVTAALRSRDTVATGRLGIDEVTPIVSNGRYPSKAVVCEVVPVAATVWREGHDAVAATVLWWRDEVGEESASEVRMRPLHPEPDRFGAEIVPDAEGAWSFRVDAWSDPWGTWRHTVEVKVAAGQEAAELANDLEIGARLLDRAAQRLQDAEPRPTNQNHAAQDHAVQNRTTQNHATQNRATQNRATSCSADGLAVEVTQARQRGQGGTDGHTSGGGAMTPPAPASSLPASSAPPMSPAPQPSPLTASTLSKAAASLRDTSLPLAQRLALALSKPVSRTMTEYPIRELVTPGTVHHMWVERPLALAGAWYEFFPRSTGGWDTKGQPAHGTFATAAHHLERIAAMGFDVAYLPPIHPIGRVNRKGQNNATVHAPHDPGSPWAIGSAEGGHDSIHPDLGTLSDFDAFVGRARELGIEIALDLALQCAPDHPWVAAHPDWFIQRPDGSIAYAENPPKRYQDVYPLNFDADPEGLYAEVLRVVLHWVAHGVRVFRVDNPHTKPPNFWHWLIDEVHRVDPGVLFLSEAFTRPARLFGLAKLGFSQSYTYFTWRTGKQELADFFRLHRDHMDECRPNCFVNTHDILHESLQTGGPAMFALRAALAATLSPSWGVYSGYELFERVPVRAGSEEYLDSEKYQLHPRDFAGALAEGRSLEPWITRLNQIRREHPALRQLRTLHFHDINNDFLLAYSKSDPATGDTVICVVTLHPFSAQEGTLRLDMPALGLDWQDRFTAYDEVSGQTFDWGEVNYVRLEPWRDVAHVVAVYH